MPSLAICPSSSIYKYFFVLLRERIIEYRVNLINVGPLARLSVEKFVLSVGARTSAPGGGSVAALLAGLVCFVFFFVVRKYEDFVPFFTYFFLSCRVGLRLVDNGRPNDLRQTSI